MTDHHKERDAAIGVMDKLKLGQTDKPTDHILTAARAAVHGDRNADYGPPTEDFHCAAQMLTAYLSRTNGMHVEVTSDDIPMLMILVKTARQAHKHKTDNLVDIAGYAECAAWVSKELAK